MSMNVKAWLLKMKGWLTNTQTRLIAGCIVGAVLVVSFALAGQIEHRKRLATEHKLSQTIQAKQLIEAKLAASEQRSQKLADALDLKTQEVDQVVRRLEEEANAVELLKGRLAQTESQINQLQAELVLSVRAREELAKAQAGSAPIELEKIKVTVRPLGLSGDSGKIIQVNLDWQFVVVDLGWNALSIGDVLGIYQGDELIAKAKVERVQEQVAEASILPEYQTAAIAMNSRVVKL